MENELKNPGLNIALISIDPWQNPIPARLQKDNAAENFYRNAFRWNDVFEQLIIPLRKGHGIQLTTTLINTRADEYYDLTFDYTKIDILIIEGILLFQERFLKYYDFKVWIDCSFETGIKRAILRKAEKLDEQQLIHDYITYYYPAQQLHFEKDKPLSLADIVWNNNENDLPAIITAEDF